MSKLTRVTTVDGSNVLINNGAPVKLLTIKGEEASTTVVTLKDNAGTPATVAVLSVGAIPLAGQLYFHGAEFPLGLNISIAATGKNLLVIWEPV